MTREAMAAYLESLQERGDPVPPPISEEIVELQVHRLPVVSGRRAIGALERAGYVVDRQRGSHVVLRHSHPPFRRLVVPDHPELARGTLRAILRQAGLSVEEFLDLL